MIFAFKKYKNVSYCLYQIVFNQFIKYKLKMNKSELFPFILKSTKSSNVVVPTEQTNDAEL